MKVSIDLNVLHELMKPLSKSKGWLQLVKEVKNDIQILEQALFDEEELVEKKYTHKEILRIQRKFLVDFITYPEYIKDLQNQEIDLDNIDLEEVTKDTLSIIKKDQDRYFDHQGVI